MQKKKPLTRQHMDYYLVCMEIQDKLTETSIITAIDSDNSAITMTPSSLQIKKKFGLSYWKFIALVFKRMPVKFNSSPHIILIGLNSKIFMTNGSFRTQLNTEIYIYINTEYGEQLEKWLYIFFINRYHQLNLFNFTKSLA